MATTMPPFKRPAFYGVKRRYRSVIPAIAVLFLTGDPFAAILTQVLSSLFWDWWFFSFKKRRESDLVSNAFLAAKQMTKKQVDDFSDFFVMTRRLAFVWSYMISLSAYLYDFGISYKTAFMASCMLINLGALCYCLIKKMPCPYTSLEDEIDPQNAHFRRAFPETSRSSRWDDRSDYMSITNPIGFTNSCSPNYIGKSLFDN